MMNMKLALLAIVAISISTLEVTAEKYTNKFDSVNVDNILGNGRILQNYVKCLLDQGPCTQEGRELKKLLPDALNSDCSKCSDVQKKNSQKVINYLRTNKASEWNKLLGKYDPKGVYLRKHERALNNKS